MTDHSPDLLGALRLLHAARQQESAEAFAGLLAVAAAVGMVVMWWICGRAAASHAADAKDEGDDR